MTLPPGKTNKEGCLAWDLLFVVQSLRLLL